jgi:PHS family inorganic phosphate transporter-like MFS transporter
MMASVFFMQPLGQIWANLVSLIVIATSRSDTNDLTMSVDRMWRYVIGIGVIPAAIATCFRFFVPESPRFLMEIDDDPVKVEFDATTLFTEPNAVSSSPTLETESWHNFPGQAYSLTTITAEDRSSTSQTGILQPATLNSHWRLTWKDIVQYFWVEGNWRTLAGTAMSWFFLDFGFYGISLSSPQFLAKTWGSIHLSAPAPYWETNDSPGASVYDMFFASCTHALVILNVGSFAGGLLLILVIHKLDRVALQKYSFLALSALFIALGCMLITIQKEGPVAVVLYVIGQALFNFGM